MKKILVYIFNIVAGYWSSWITGALMRVIAAEKKNISMKKKVGSKRRTQSVEVLYNPL